jgi:cbb3-type cytochrome oxidase subunit 3
MKLTEQQQQLLNQLQDIQLPDPIGWWPLSYTWWLLIFMVSSLLVGLIWYYFDQKKRNAYRIEALAHLNTLENQPNNPNQQLLEINRLLKQVALTCYPRTEVAALNDQAWLDFLAKTAAHVKQPDHLLAILKRGYQPPNQNPIQAQEAQYALNQFKQYAQAWIKGHHQ